MGHRASRSFVQGNAEDARDNAASYLEIQGSFYACGQDPFFPPSQDVLHAQRVRRRALDREMIETISGIAAQSDGIRCDMSMVILNQVFRTHCGSRTGRRPTTEDWVDVVAAIGKPCPDFVFMAEAYWGLEWGLQQKGFDFCYDKRLSDRLETDNPERVRLGLCADLAYQQKLLRFLENHNEPRAAAAFPPPKEQARRRHQFCLPGARFSMKDNLKAERCECRYFSADGL